jgi:hypothetical protein
MLAIFSLPWCAVFTAARANRPATGTALSPNRTASTLCTVTARRRVSIARPGAVRRHHPRDLSRRQRVSLAGQPSQANYVEAPLVEVRTRGGLTRGGRGDVSASCAISPFSAAVA